MSTVSEIETAIFSHEGFRVIIRLPKNSRAKLYHYTNRSKEKLTVTKWIRLKLLPLFDGQIGVSDVEVICGDGSIAYGKCHLSTVRASYN